MGGLGLNQFDTQFTLFSAALVGGWLVGGRAFKPWASDVLVDHRPVERRWGWWPLILKSRGGLRGSGWIRSTPRINCSSESLQKMPATSLEMLFSACCTNPNWFFVRRLTMQQEEDPEKRAAVCICNYYRSATRSNLLVGNIPAVADHGPGFDGGSNCSGKVPKLENQSFFGSGSAFILARMHLQVAETHPTSTDKVLSKPSCTAGMGNFLRWTNQPKTINVLYISRFLSPVS